MTAPTALDRAARALCRSRGDHCNYSNSVNVCDAHGCYMVDDAHGAKEELQEQVRAVLAAIDPPTPGMVEAGYDTQLLDSPLQPAAVWAAMLAAAREGA